MAASSDWTTMGDTPWGQRALRARDIGDRWAVPEATADEDAQAHEWLASVDPSQYVGSRHHTVPRFVLKRWANDANQVQVFHKIEVRRQLQNISDLAIKDFYTVVNQDGTKSSAMESLLGIIERQAEGVINALLSPFASRAPITAEMLALLHQFAAFQSTRTSRFRREIELQAEWYVKTMSGGRAPDDELRKLTIAPHQNESITLAGKSAEGLIPFFACRPLAVVYLGAPLLLMSDEPVLINSSFDDTHSEDCFLSDEEIEARMARRLGKVKKKRRGRVSLPGRTVHISSTRPTGHAVADEIVLPISPRAALLWGPLADRPQLAPPRQIRLEPREAAAFVEMANDAMCAQALDWIIGRPTDSAFSKRAFPPSGPLLRVCDGDNAASFAINHPPRRYRPRRLWAPDTSR